MFDLSSAHLDELDRQSFRTARRSYVIGLCGRQHCVKWQNHTSTAFFYCRPHTKWICVARETASPARLPTCIVAHICTYVCWCKCACTVAWWLHNNWNLLPTYTSPHTYKKRYVLVVYFYTQVALPPQPLTYLKWAFISTPFVILFPANHYAFSSFFSSHIFILLHSFEIHRRKLVSQNWHFCGFKI